MIFLDIFNEFKQNRVKRYLFNEKLIRDKKSQKSWPKKITVTKAFCVKYITLIKNSISKIRKENL